MIAGRYELVEEIGRGGMGAVWRGVDSVLQREVALKRIEAVDDVAVARTTREARLAAQVNHPHVVAVYDLVDDGSESWLVMEMVDGTSLAERIADHGALERGEVARIGAEVAEALAAAHAAGIVHRDVKPSNVLLPIDGPAKLADFGVARGANDDALTRTGLVTGSPAYLSPEVAAGQRAVAASDIWSLGATLVHAATGRPPYEGTDHVMGTLYRIVNEAPPRLEGDDVLAAVVAETLQKEVTARPSASAVAARLASTPEPDATRTMPVVPEAIESTTPSRNLWPLAAGVVAATAVVVTLATTLGDDGPSPAFTAAESAAPSPTASATTEPKPTTVPAGPSAEELEEFARDYVETAADDPDDAFALLVPEYQERSGGLDGYRAFWDRVDDPEITAVSADADAMTVDYTYTYELSPEKPGKGKAKGKKEQRTETVRLQLQEVEGDLRVYDATTV